MRTHIFAAISLGLLAAACQSPSQQARYASPPAPAYAHASSEQVCTEYGFTAGTITFDRCVSQERAARAHGRVSRDYSQTRLSEDARIACNSYGLQSGTGSYDQCVNREVEARRYQASPTASPYRIDQSGNRIDSEGYRVDTYGNRLPRQS